MRARAARAPEDFLTFMSGVTRADAGYTPRAVRVLIVEDERKLARALREGLEAESYEVTVASTGEDGFFLANHDAFDLVVLDLMLPGRGGLEVLTTLRKRELQTAVLILTAKDTIDDRVQGLGGTGVLCPAGVPFDRRGFPRFGEKPYAKVTAAALGAVPTAVMAIG